MLQRMERHWQRAHTLGPPGWERDSDRNGSALVVVQLALAHPSPNLC